MSDAVADLVFVEGPDHEPYSDAYIWQPVDMSKLGDILKKIRRPRPAGPRPE